MPFPRIIGYLDDLRPEVNGAASYLSIFRSPHTIITGEQYSVDGKCIRCVGSSVSVVQVGSAPFLQIDTMLNKNERRRVYAPIGGKAKLLTAFIACGSC
jgi:hypothetical protein